MDDVYDYYPKTIHNLSLDELKICEKNIVVIRECSPIHNSKRFLVLVKGESRGVFWKKNFAYDFCDMMKRKY